MSATWKTVRVFISSTFRDMHAERDHLVTVVFPELRERAEQLGLEFFDVDLRWGVPEKNADGEKANSWEYCKKWIDRVEPFFVSLLGQRYGYVPKPQDIRDNADRRQYADLSITEMEIRHAVLTGRLKRRSFFYFRKTKVPEATPAETRNTFVEDDDKVENLKQLIKQSPRPVHEYSCDWIEGHFANLNDFGVRVLEDLWSGVLRDERYVNKEVWRQALGTDPDSDARYTDEAKPVPSDLAKKLVALAKPAPLSLLDAEKKQMQAFAQARLRWFQGRTKELKQLTDFINSTDEKAPPLAAVIAVRGQGKSALLAKLSTLNFQPSAFLITHFVGATERSANAYALVERLLGELDRSGIAWPAEERQEGQEPKRDFNSLCLRLAQRLGDYAGERRIVILLDALNQLSDGHDLVWLPQRLGPQVHIVISCVEESRSSQHDEAHSSIAQPSTLNSQPSDQSLLTSSTTAQEHEQRVLHALTLRQPAPLRVPLGPLTEDDVRTIVVAYLDEYCKVLDTPHVNTICAMLQARNPLYLLVMLGELRTLGGNDMNKIVGERIASMPQDHPDTVSLFRWVLQRLEEAEGFGKVAVQWWCLYLAHGRVGMASHEMADLLASKLGVECTEAADKARRTALRIERGLRRYLQRRGPQLDIFHGQLRQAVFEQYRPQSEAVNIHSDIATYFETRWRKSDRHALSELPYHQTQGQMWKELEATLSALEFIEAHSSLGMIVELQNDFVIALKSWPGRDWDYPFDYTESEQIPDWLTDCTRAVIDNARDPHPNSGTGPILARLRGIPEGERGFILTEPKKNVKERLGASIFLTDSKARELASWIHNQEGRPGDDDDDERGWRLVQAFFNFVNSQAASLAQNPDDNVAIARNYANAGSVVSAAETLIQNLSRVWVSRDPRPPRPPLRNPILKILPGGRWSAFGNAVVITSDGCTAVALETRDRLRVWDIEKGRPLAALIGHSAAITAIAISGDGRRVLSGDDAKSLRVWDATTGNCLYACCLDRGIGSVAISADGRLGISGPGHDLSFFMEFGTTGELAKKAGLKFPCEVWSLESGKPIRSLVGHTNFVYAVSMTPDARLAVTRGFDKQLMVWDVSTGRLLRRFEVSESTFGRVAISPGGNLIAADDSEVIHVWDTLSGDCIRKLPARACTLNFLFDGHILASSGNDYTLRIWNLVSGECLKAASHATAVQSLCFSSNARIAVSTGNEAELYVWDVKAALFTGRKPSNPTWISSLAISAGGSVLITRMTGKLDDEMHLELLNHESLSVIKEIDMSGAWTHLTPHPDESFVVTAKDNILSLWNLSTGLQARQIVASADVNSRLRRVAVSPDGRFAISSGPDCAVRVWDLLSGAPARHIKGVNPRDVSTRIVLLLVQAIKHQFKIDLNLPVVSSGDIDNQLRSHPAFAGLQTEPVTCVAISPDGDVVIAATDLGTILVWDLWTTKPLRRIARHESPITAMCISPDGRFVLTAAGKEGIVCACEVTSGKLIRQFVGRSGDVTCIQFSSDGELVVSGGIDGTLRVWDWRTGRQLCVYPTNTGVGEADNDERCRSADDSLTHVTELGIRDVTAINPTGMFACIDDRGTLHNLQLENYSAGIPIVTACRFFQLQSHFPSDTPPSDCSIQTQVGSECGSSSVVPDSQNLVTRKCDGGIIMN
jgi:WD40 repeat protein